MTFPKDQSEVADVCVIIPKEDEFNAHLAVFGIISTIDDLPTMHTNELPYATVELDGLRVVLVCMQQQGNTAAAGATQAVLARWSPLHVYLSGTALGNPRRSPLGAVRVSEHVDHVEQWVEEGTFKRPRMAHYKAYRNSRRDLGNFINRFNSKSVLRTVVSPHLQSAYPETWDHLIQDASLVPELAYMVTDNALVRDEGSRLWEHEERAASYDMECGGFASIMDSTAGVAWAVIRGVSDHGGDKARAETGMRLVASTAAACFLRSFLIRGLRLTHPTAMRPQQQPSVRLSENQHYAKYSASKFFTSEVRKKFRVDLPVTVLHRDTVLADVVTFLQIAGVPRTKALEFCASARRRYFERKYLNYDYSVDIRGLLPTWRNEFREFLGYYGYENLADRHILDVGCGNGLELAGLFETSGHPESLTCVDLSAKMLAAVETRWPDARTVVGLAEDLRQIPSASIDLYISLRTFMSRFCDTNAAFREALRVLQPGGLLVVSIANGYLDQTEEGEAVIVPGLKDAGGGSTVDVERPLELLSKYYATMRRLGFTQVFALTRLTDVYVGGLRPGPRTMAPRLPSNVP